VKLSSIIILIISILLILIGFFTCKYARSLAPNDAAIDGADISDGQLFSEIAYSDQNVSKIVLDLSDCSVTIRGGADSSYVELTNFEPNKYIGSVSNKSLTLSNNISISDYLSLDGTGVQFAGVWQTLRSYYLADEIGKRKAVIYISDDEDIKQLSLTLDNCNIRVLDVQMNCDVTVTAVNSTMEFNTVDVSSFKVTCSDQSSLSMLSVSSDTMELSINDCPLTGLSLLTSSLSIEATKTDISLYSILFNKLDLTLDEGDVALSTDYQQADFSRNIQIGEGEIQINKEYVGTSDIQENPDLLGSISITINTGSLDIQYGDLSIPDPDSTTSNPTAPTT
jgi:hypothetical protein